MKGSISIEDCISDTDMDGIPDEIDGDDDNDGTPDGSDAFPLDKSEDTDNNGDGIGDNSQDDLGSKSETSVLPLVAIVLSMIAGIVIFVYKRKGLYRIQPLKILCH